MTSRFVRYLLQSRNVQRWAVHMALPWVENSPPVQLSQPKPPLPRRAGAVYFAGRGLAARLSMELRLVANGQAEGGSGSEAPERGAP